MTDQLLKISQVANLLATSPGTVRAMIKRGDVPAVRVSQRVIRVPQSAIDKILAPLGAPIPRQSGRNRSA